ncbi:MAG: hypothetical protein ACYC6Y_32230, partial [Thermoguttaceae bacterium]
TPLSAVIIAQADALASEGYFLESAAIARRHHALAAKQEEEFREVRERFEAARDEVVGVLGRNEELTWEQQQAIMEAVNRNASRLKESHRNK